RGQLLPESEVRPAIRPVSDRARPVAAQPPGRLAVVHVRGRRSTRPGTLIGVVRSIRNDTRPTGIGAWDAGRVRARPRVGPWRAGRKEATMSLRRFSTALPLLLLAAA